MSSDKPTVTQPTGVRHGHREQVKRPVPHLLRATEHYNVDGLTLNNKRSGRGQGRLYLDCVFVLVVICLHGPRAGHVQQYGVEFHLSALLSNRLKIAPSISLTSRMSSR